VDLATALAEDLGTGDITGSLLPDRDTTLALVARQAGVLAGTSVIAELCAIGGTILECTPPTSSLLRADGETLSPGDTVAVLEGSLHVLLAIERTMLNLLTHLSGVATLTRAYVEAIRGTGAVIRDTRKTTPGLRALEKAAVVAGGGANHRMGLYDAVLIKDNHLAHQDMAHLVASARARYPQLPLEVEVDDLEGLATALALGVELVLLDNFCLADLRAAVALTSHRARLEASGGVTLATAGDIARTGVDFLAVGALTHSAPSLDLGLDALS
jgi:nicotinate-nucleotide pyrophosphorylase (carboxylating)